MSGHSKWATIKHKKGAKDKARGKLFSKLIRFIEVAAREGGGDLESNPTLATAVQKAKDAQMPNDTIERAIKRGTGDLEGVSYEEASYEGYGPGGVAFYVTVLTDNRNRAASDVRSLFTKNGGSLGEPGSVAWKFDTRGVIVVPATSIEEDDLLELALEAGADDIESDGSTFEVRTAPGDFLDVRKALESAGVDIEQAEVAMIPQNTTPVDESKAGQVLRLVEDLENVDDVQEVYTDFDIPEDVLAKLA